MALLALGFGLRGPWHCYPRDLAAARGRHSRPGILCWTHFMPGQVPAFGFAAFLRQWGGGCGTPRGVDLGYTSLDERGLVTAFFPGLVSALPGQWGRWPRSHVQNWRWWDSQRPAGLVSTVQKLIRGPVLWNLGTILGKRIPKHLQSRVWAFSILFF